MVTRLVRIARVVRAAELSLIGLSLSGCHARPSASGAPTSEPSSSRAAKPMLPSTVANALATVTTLDRPLYQLCVDDDHVYGVEESEPSRVGVPIRYDLVTIDRHSGHVDRQHGGTIFALSMDRTHLYWDAGGVLFARRKGESSPRELERSTHGAFPLVLWRHRDAVYWQRGAEVHRAKDGNVEVVGSLGEATTLLAVDDAFFYTDGTSLESKPAVARVSRTTGARAVVAPVWDIAKLFVDDGSVYWIDTRFWLHIARAGVKAPHVLDDKAYVRELAVDGGVAWGATALGLRRYADGAIETRHALSEQEEVFGRPAIHGGRVFVALAPPGAAPRVVSLPR